VEQFAGGAIRNYYGKGDVTVYRLRRSGARPGTSAVFGANVKMLVYGDAFWPTYTTGDNTGLIATDSMKNFIQREALAYEGASIEDLCRLLSDRFLAKYPQVEGVQVSAEEVPYAPLPHGVGFAPAGPERATARVEITRQRIADATCGLRGFRLLRLGGSAFHGFVRDEYTTLPDLEDRPLHMWLDLEWRCSAPEATFGQTGRGERIRALVRDVFESFESGSIQQVIYQMATRLLAEMPELSDVHLEANNRTWDTIAEQSDAVGIYTDPRPPYGCLGLRLTRG
jgi:urate oxidase / 2-oxo-4-hydroxy-4-carboxy-5-ureidoimidazoline decarboxylase